MGPFPALAPETEPEPKFDTDTTGDSEETADGALEDVFKEGDHLFYMKLPTEKNSGRDIPDLLTDSIPTTPRIPCPPCCTLSLHTLAASSDPHPTSALFGS